MLAERRQIGFMCGAPRMNSAVVLVCSFINSPISVMCNGETKTPILAQIGVLYYGHVTFYNLAPATIYPVTLQQGSITESDCSVTTNCDAFTRCKLWFNGCDNPSAVFGGAQKGGYGRIAKSRKAGGLHYMIFADDWGYPSKQTVNDVILGLAHTNSAAVSGLAADYVLSYANNLGMLADTSDRNIRWGRDADRVYVTRNMPWMLQIGDWEVENDRGWDNAGPGALYDTAIGVFNALFSPLRPETDIRNRDITALHWGITVGNTRIVATDNVTNGSGGYIDGTTAITTQLGNNQIDDCLDALNTDEACKILVMNVGDRYFEAATAATPEFQAGQQHPLFNHCIEEYRRLYTRTGATQKSLMDNPKTNGTLAFLLVWHGDTHRGGVYNNQAAAYAGNAAENWWSWFLGSSNGSINFGLSSAGAIANCVDGGGYGGTSVVYTQESGITEHGHHRWHTLCADVRGDLPVFQINVELQSEVRLECGAIFKVGSNQPSRV
jgi:hypothetical protein